eukprot:1156964-Pelagomonas_calceolata.AAC.7
MPGLLKTITLRLPTTKSMRWAAAAPAALEAGSRCIQMLVPMLGLLKTITLRLSTTKSVKKTAGVPAAEAGSRRGFGAVSTWTCA